MKADNGQGHILDHLKEFDGCANDKLASNLFQS